MVTYAMAGLIVGAIISAIALLAVKNKKARVAAGWVGAGLLVIGILPILVPSITGSVPFLGQEIKAGGTVIPQLTIVPSTLSTPSANGCLPGQQVEDTTVTLSAIDKYTSIASGGTHRYKINSGPALTVSDAGTFTASPGDKVSILWYNASTSGGYFSDVSTESVPCSGTKVFSKEIGRNGTITIQVFNEEGNVLDTTTENETLAAGDTVTLKAEIRGTYQRSAPYGGLLIVEYNTTEIDNVIADFGEGTTSVPISAQYYAVAATDHAVKAYKVPAVDSNKLLTGTIYIDVDDSINPGNGDDIDLAFRQSNYFINDDTGGSFDLGVEDEDNAGTQPTNTITFTLSTD